MKSKRLSIGIDLGGTKIATGLVDAQGRLLLEDRRPSKAANHALLKPNQQIRYCVDAMADAARALVDSRPGRTTRQKSASIRAVGLAAAGPLDVVKGRIIYPANFQGWGIVPIVKLLGEALKKRDLALPIHFQNDAVAAALGEGWVGRAKGCTSYAMITLGTGIGTGVILNGLPAQSKGMGSEWGHILIDRPEMLKHPDDFYHATAEGLASGTGMLRLAHRLGFKGLTMADLAESGRDKKDRHHKMALDVFAKASQALAMLFFNLAIGFHVDKFIVTGGLLPIRHLFLPSAVEMYKRMILDMNPAFYAPVVLSKAGNKAGMIGAGRLGFL